MIYDSDAGSSIPHRLPEEYKIDSIPIPDIEGPDAVHAREETEEKNKRRQQLSHHKKEEAKDHFEELARAAETAHITLVQNQSPYRFCVYKKEQEIFIDIVYLNKKGKITRTIKKNITHEEFHKILQDIAAKEGLFFDAKF